MILDSTSDEVRLITSAAASIEVHVGWADWDTGPTFVLGSDDLVITTATTTDIVASPTGTVKRQVKNLLIRNDHASTACDVTVEHFDGTDTVQVKKFSLLAGESAEYDGGHWHYYTASGIEKVYDASVEDTEYVIRAASDRVLTSTTSEQPMFNNPTNGRVTLPTGVYFFDWHAIITGMSATSGNARLDILGTGTATLTNILWSLWGLDNTTPATIADDDAAYFQVDTSAASAVAAGTGTAMRFAAQGMFGVSSGGTLQPALALVTAAAATVQNGSYFRIKRVGDLGFASKGPWD